MAPKATISGASTGLSNPHGLGFDSSGRLFVANAGNSVTEYPRRQREVAPKATISGASTGLNFPEGLGFDSSGRLFVANGHGNSVTEYAPGASGNVAPTATISSPAPG